MNVVAGVQVFVGVLYGKQGKDLSNWISKNLHEKPYWRILSEGKATIISSRSFPGAKRHDKRNFMRKILPTILDEPWTKGKRISCSKSISKLFPKNRSTGANVHYGFVAGYNQNEYAQLKTDYDKAVWMSKQEYFYPYPEGLELLKRYGLRA